MIACGDFERAPGFARLEGRIGREAAERLLFAGQEPVGRNLPGAVVDRAPIHDSTGECTRHLLRDIYVLAEQSETAEVVIELWCVSDPLAIRNRGRGGGAGGTIAEEGLQR